MDEAQARKKIRMLKAFYRHLLWYLVIIPCLAVVNVMTYLQGDEEIWVIYPALFWGVAVLMNGLAVHGGFGFGKKWEEEKLRQLTGWDATQEELARLSERVETLLTIVSSDEGRETDTELAEIRQTLLDARRAIDHYRAPLDSSGEASLDKHAMIKAIEKLEAVLTSRAFQHYDETKTTSASKSGVSARS